jgi:hypothetical protein
MTIETRDPDEIRLALEDKIWRVEAENRRLRSKLRDAQAIAEEQIDDTTLWLEGETPREERLSKELARLHMVLTPCTGL